MYAIARMKLGHLYIMPMQNATKIIISLFMINIVKFLPSLVFQSRFPTKILALGSSKL